MGRCTGSLRAVLGYLFKPPGWAPEGSGFTTEELRAGTQRSTPQPG